MKKVQGFDVILSIFLADYIKIHGKYHCDSSTLTRFSASPM